MFNCRFNLFNEFIELSYLGNYANLFEGLVDLFFVDWMDLRRLTVRISYL